jgi:hypothetical protein
MNEWKHERMKGVYFLNNLATWQTLCNSIWCSISQKCIHKHVWQGFKAGNWLTFYFRYTMSFLNSNWSIHWSVSLRLQIRTFISAAVICSLPTMYCDRFSYLPVICNKDTFRDLSLNSQHVMNCPSFGLSATDDYSNTVFPSSLFIFLNGYLELHKSLFNCARACIFYLLFF